MVHFLFLTHYSHIYKLPQTWSTQSSFAKTGDEIKRQDKNECAGKKEMGNQTDFLA